MNIKYVWNPIVAGQNELTSLVLVTGHIPRVGELVEIDIQRTQDEWVVKSGRVKDVIWMVRREPMVTVILGA